MITSQMRYTRARVTKEIDFCYPQKYSGVKEILHYVYEISDILETPTLRTIDGIKNEC